MRQIAKENHNKTVTQLKRWWVKKYKLPPNHDLFTSQTYGELFQEFYEDLIFEKMELEAQIENAKGEIKDNLAKRINAISEMLGEGVAVVTDALVDKWEEALARGEVPDLDEV